jgi:hypothetical protein
MSRLIFVPSSRTQAQELRAGGETGPWLAFSASPGLRAELGDLSVEELEYVALNHAGVALLVDPSAADPLRLVLAADVPEDDLLDVDIAESGAATVTALAWSRVVALFADDPDAASAVAAARAAVRDRPVSEALAAPEVTALLEAHDLGWYAPEELDRLP